MRDRRVDARARARPGAQTISGTCSSSPCERMAVLEGAVVEQLLTVVGREDHEQALAVGLVLERVEKLASARSTPSSSSSYAASMKPRSAGLSLTCFAVSGAMLASGRCNGPV